MAYEPEVIEGESLQPLQGYLGPPDATVGVRGLDERHRGGGQHTEPDRCCGAHGGYQVAGLALGTRPIR